MIYGYGIDPAQSLNYCGIVVTKIEDDIRLVTIRKLRNIMYPELARLLFDDLFKRFPPAYICMDYTNEKSLSETIEAKSNPSFLSPTSSEYHKWRLVEPITFSQDTKLALKQNARELFENKKFLWPKMELSDSRIWSLVEELKEQMMREAGIPGFEGQLKFPKPEGHDNDLIVALELNLYGAKRFLPDYAPRWFWIRA